MTDVEGLTSKEKLEEQEAQEEEVEETEEEEKEEKVEKAEEEKDEEKESLKTTSNGKVTFLDVSNAPSDEEYHQQSSLMTGGVEVKFADSMRHSLADHSRPDHFRQLLIKHRSSVKLMFDDTTLSTATEEEDVTVDGEIVKGSKYDCEVFRKISENYSRAKEHNTNFDVEVRLHDVSYHVPIKTTSTIRTITNQNFCYKIIHKCFNLCKFFSSDMSTLSYSRIFSPIEKRKILHNMNLIFKPGHSYLVLGPPGSGKTSLLKAIAGLVREKYDLSGQPVAKHPHISGRIGYNGLTTNEAPEMVLQNVVSFVEQIDFHEPYLTVKETFDFAFQCRTGGKQTYIADHLTIEGLGLGYVADTYVGNADVRGCSGGQRRRVTVGETMQGLNPVACADEISTGLDSASTFEMIRSIVYFAKAARTTRIISLLQPGPETFSLFDEVVILSEGFVIYAAPIDDVAEYFEDLGYIKPVAMDLADFLQSVSTPDGADMLDPHIRTDGHLTSEQFANYWNSSTHGKHIVDELLEDIPTRWDVGDLPQGDAENPMVSSTPLPEKMKIMYQNSNYVSTKLIFRRFLSIWKRNVGLIIGKAIEGVAMAITLGTVLLQTGRIQFSCNDERIDPNDIDKLLNGIYGSLFLALFRIAQGNATDIAEEVKSRGIHYKHADANFYQHLSYIFGQVLSTLPQRAIESVAFVIPVYFLISFDLSAESFLLYFLLMFLFSICIKLLFTILVMSLSTVQRVQSASLCLLLLMTLFGGFIMFPSSIPTSVHYFYWANPMAWAYQGFLSIEFTSSKYDVVSECYDPKLFLSTRGFRTGREWIGWSFLFIIMSIVFSILMLILASKYLRFDSKGKAESSKENDMEDERAESNFPFTKINLTFENLCFDVKASTSDETLRLLHNVSGVLRAGRMCALMGSSGAGKTTLMDVISLRKTAGEITGKVELNGFPQEKNSFLRSSGYVEQFDIQAAQLTVLETVLFSACLRLDSRNEATKDKAGKLRFVENVLEMLELTSLKNQQVGELELGTGLSFEQRKRLAIAVELAGSPSILFLDEPTSGLDSRGALLVMRAMKRIANTGRTICATIHQPSSAVFEMFDDLLLLNKGGRLAYFGELGENSFHLTNYFEMQGCDAIAFGQNPASWMLSVTKFKEPAEWAELYTSSDKYSVLMDQIHTERESPDQAKKIFFEDIFPTTTKQRLSLMTSRLHKIYFRSPGYIVSRLVFLLFMALLLLYGFKSLEWVEHEVESLFGTLFFALIISGITFIMGVIPVMKKVRDVFYKHRASGMITHHEVAFASIVVEMPYVLLSSFLFSILCFRIESSVSSVGQFFTFYGFFTLNAAIYTYFGQFFISLVEDIPTAMALSGAILGINAFGSGYIIKPKFGVTTFYPIFYLSPGHYALEGIIWGQCQGNEVSVLAKEGSAYFQSLNCTEDQTDECLGTIEDYATFAFGDKFSHENMGLDFGVLFGYLIVALIGLHWALGRFNYVNT